MSFSRWLAWVFLLASTGFAQSDRGAITGTVLDPGGAVIPGASITAVHAETGAQYETITTPTGNYTISSLPVGAYSVTIAAPGFRKLIRTGITVEVAQTARPRAGPWRFSDDVR